jgi:hypothetical protein
MTLLRRAKSVDTARPAATSASRAGELAARSRPKYSMSTTIAADRKVKLSSYKSPKNNALERQGSGASP